MKPQIITPMIETLPLTYDNSGWCDVMEQTTRIIALSTSKRNRFADRKGSFHHLQVDQLVVNLIKAAVQAITRFVEPKMAELGADADMGEVLAGLDWSGAAASLIRDARFFFAKAYCQLSLQRAIEFLLIKFGHAKLAGKFTKNPALSATRKAQKFGRLPAAKLMVMTTAYSTFLSYATFIVVDSVIIIFTESRKVETDKSTKLANIHKAVTKICLQHVTCFSCGVAGHAIGTLIYPGLGTNLVGLLAELGSMTLVS